MRPIQKLQFLYWISQIAVPFKKIIDRSIEFVHDLTIRKQIQTYLAWINSIALVGENKRDNFAVSEIGVEMPQIGCNCVLKFQRHILNISLMLVLGISEEVRLNGVESESGCVDAVDGEWESAVSMGIFMFEGRWQHYLNY